MSKCQKSLLGRRYKVQIFLTETCGDQTHTHRHAHTWNQCRLMAALMGKCTGFPQGHQRPAGFNWEEQILLSSPSSPPSSPARDNTVCILIHRRVTHSVSRQREGIGVAARGHKEAKWDFCLHPMKNIIESLHWWLLSVPLLSVNRT